MIARLLCSLAVPALLFASVAYAELRGKSYTVKDLRWCLSIRGDPTDTGCMVYILGVAGAARHGAVRFKDQRVCWPKGEPMSYWRVFKIVMKHERMDKWDPRAPAIGYIVTALAEAYPCK
jgi:hypothetical protein